MAAKAKTVARKLARPPRAAPELTSILAELKRSASPQYKADMARRYGIVTRAPAYGVPVARLRAMAKAIGQDHALAQLLWSSGVHDARMLAPMVGEHRKVTPAEMDRWARDFDNWAIVDTACFHYWDRSPHAVKQIEKWAKAKDEFVKRAAFALLASAALHKTISDEQCLRGLDLIEDHARDPRNFVKKAVNWALRAIGGKKSPQCRSAAREVAERLSTSDEPTERWVGRDAMRAFAKAK
jgi:3-methyladenine DNA glycosylase AlkD